MSKRVLLGAAAPAACNHPAWSNQDAGSGYGVGSQPVRTGPSSDCGVVFYTGTGRLLYHCYYVNGAGNRWTHVRLEGTNIEGWIYGGNLTNGGATHRC